MDNTKAYSSKDHQFKRWKNGNIQHNSSQRHKQKSQLVDLVKADYQEKRTGFTSPFHMQCTAKNPITAGTIYSRAGWKETNVKSTIKGTGFLGGNEVLKFYSDTNLCSLEPVHNKYCECQTKCVSQKCTLEVLGLLTPGDIKTECQCNKNAWKIEVIKCYQVYLFKQRRRCKTMEKANNKHLLKKKKVQ